MQESISNSESLPNAGLGHASQVDENVGGASDTGAQQHTSTDAIGGTIPKKLSSRERLDLLSHLRIGFDTISFPPSTSHREGGYAKVIQATFRTEAGNEETVAVKKLNYTKGIDIRKFSNEFVNEVEILARLSHDNVVRLIGFVEDLKHKEAWMVLSWHPNGNVREFLAKGKWEIPERISLIKDTFEGLSYLHSHEPPICHGDLKSLNILVSSSYRAIITDFGSARVLDKLADRVVHEDRDLAAMENSNAGEAKIQVGAADNHLTLTGPAWSLRWASPEVLYGAAPNLPSDIWSAGWICWEIMTNQVPFPELNSEGVITLTVIRGKVPSTREDAQLSQITRLCSLMTDCWKFDPESRPDVAQCRTEVAWMPSTPPSSVKASLPLLFSIGTLHSSHGRYEETASLYRKALASTVTTPEEIAQTLLMLGYTYNSQSKYSEAKNSFIQAHGIFTRSGDEHGRATALEGLGTTYIGQVKYPEAEEPLFQAQQIFASIGKDQRRATTLITLGYVYRFQAKYSEAEEFLIQAQQIYTHIRDDQGRAKMLLELGQLYGSQRAYSKAEESLIHAQQIFTLMGDDQKGAHALLRLACFYCAQAKYSKMEDPLIQAQQIFVRMGDDPGWANALGGLAVLYRLQKKYSEAEESSLQAQQINTRIGNDEGVASELVGLGVLYCSQNRDSEAEKPFIKAQQIYTRIGNDWGQANALQMLGNLYHSQTKYPEAEESLVQAQQIYTRIGNHQGRAKALQGLGELYISQSKHSEAKELIIQAEQIFDRIGTDPDRVLTLVKLASIYISQRKYSEAEELFIQTQEICTRLGNDECRAHTLCGRGHIRRGQGRKVESAAFYAEAKDLFAQLGQLDGQEEASRWLAVVSQE